MNKQNVFLIVLLVVIVSSAVVTDCAVGQITMQFPATRDWTVYGWFPEQMKNTGHDPYLRGFKFGGENSAHFDFDTEAMGQFLLNNPGEATWTLNVFPIDNPHLPTDLPVGFQTVESTNDWVEGDAPDHASNFNWTSGTAAATYFYAQTVHNDGVLDAESSLPWNDPDSGPYTFSSVFPNNQVYGVPASVTDSNPTPAFTNSEQFSKADLVDAATAEGATPNGPASVVVDPDIIDALINDEFNRGIRLGDPFHPDGSADELEGSNWSIWSREAGADVTTYLEVTIEAGPGLLGDYNGNGILDAADYTVWLGALGETTLLNDPTPGTVDRSDYDYWKTNIGAMTGNASSTNGVVPEPSSTVFLGVFVAILAVRRCRIRVINVV